ncbi:RodZ domain-containing protein [Thalassotalea fusca]
MSQEVMTSESVEDIEVKSPGRLLAQGRELLGFTQEQVAEKLNFRSTLVKDIENDVFDRSLPATFNRGYLKNYAKLVGINIDEVLASYELLEDEEKQNAKLQSFSKGTEKQAQHNRIMWVSYLILAALFGLTLLWYFQNDGTVEPVVPSTSVAPEVTSEPAIEQDLLASNEAVVEASTASSETDSELTDANDNVEQPAIVDSDTEIVTLADTLKPQTNTEQVEINTNDNASSGTSVDSTSPTLVVFNFSGDCWVNIYDATGERVAWGVKKSGYEMKIEGVAPFQITLGKPELVSINFQGSPVDLSAFSKGNIAKFTLPFSES